MADWKRLIAGGDGCLVKHSVNAVANPQVIFHWLEVDVGCAVVDGLADDLVDEADNRSVLRHLLDVLDLGRRLHLFGPLSLVEQAFHRVGADTVIFLDPVGDFLAGSHR